MFKGEKGITLIALAITIIVLLILAGISITALVGQDSLLGQAKTARETYETNSINESKSLDAFSAELVKLKSQNGVQ